MSAVEISVPARGGYGPSHFRALVMHLARREVDASHRMTVLGWTWPLARQLAQLGVLVFVFSHVFHSNRPHFAVFVFAGLMAWAWFAAGVSAATSSLISKRQLLFQPRFPAAVLPLVAVAVPLIDLLLALPVLVLMAALSGTLQWTIVFLPVAVAVEAVLMTGLGWLAASASVFFRDVPNIVAVGLILLFYLTPVFYEVPGRYESVLQLNPLTTILDGWRALLLGDPYPGLGRIAAVVGVSIVVAVAGFAVFRRLQDRFVDQL
jgi:lipopolysaccharide transport system permease protein